MLTKLLNLTFKQTMPMKKINRYILIFLNILCIAFVFYNSLKSGESSSETSSGFLKVFNGFLQDINLPIITEELLRSIAHFSEFFLLGILQFCLYNNLLITPKKYFPAVAFSSIFIPFIDETLQYFSVGRAAEVVDMWKDFGGYICGAIITFGIISLIKAIQKNDRKK